MWSVVSHSFLRSHKVQTDLLSVAVMMSAEHQHEQEPEQNTEHTDQCLSPADSAVLMRDECKNHPERNGGVLWMMNSQQTWIMNLGRAHSQQLLYCTTRSLFWSLVRSVLGQEQGEGEQLSLHQDQLSLQVLSFLCVFSVCVQCVCSVCGGSALCEVITSSCSSLTTTGCTFGSFQIKTLSMCVDAQ